ncbi:MAG: hypothetical protein V7664_13985 [Qipengyuania sp.]|uniref:hypothetical protein n=1 Tax=Qipengyuania sp. TaxID=2004515 RepID=UPI003002940C
MKPFSLNEEKLAEHFQAVENLLTVLVGDADLKLDIAREPAGLSMGLRNSGPCEKALRNRGGETNVAPLYDLGGGIAAWFGFREQWQINPRRGSVATYRFRSSDLTVFFGRAGILSKPQIFRAEWVGLVARGADWHFEAGDAAHPHWQFDALETYISDEEQEYARELRDALRADQSVTEPEELEVKEFGAGKPMSSILSLHEDDVSLLAKDRRLSAIHFPSVAKWWDLEPNHAHYPRNCDEIRSWIKRTLKYLRAELSRV